MHPDELHVVRIKRELDDMLNKNTLNKRRLLELLDKLASIAVDTELLQRTQVGRTVNGVRKAYSSTKEINQKAVKLIKQWKHLVKAEHGARRMSISSVQSDGSVVSPASSPDSSSNAGEESERDHQYSPVLSNVGDDYHSYLQESSGALSVSSKRIQSEDGPRPAKIRRTDSTSSTSSITSASGNGSGPAEIRMPQDETRSKAVELMHQAISGDRPPVKSNISGKTSLDLAIEIEHYVYTEIGNASDRHYKARVRSRVVNLKNNDALRDNVLSGKVSTKRLASMSTDELASDQMKQLRRSMEEESIRSREIGVDPASARSDMYKCEKCGKRDSSYSVNQERVEGDYEPVAITQVVCNQCGHRWRVY